MFKNIFYFTLLCLFYSVYTKQCYWNSNCGYSYFGTKTPYNDLRGDLRDVPKLEGCNPISVWAVIRHGTRHPGKNDTDYMKHAVGMSDVIVDSHAQGRGDMCAQDMENLKNFTWDDTLDYTQKYLTAEGYQELLDLGTRFRQTYQSLLQDLDEYQFRPTNEQRTKESAKAFVQGLGGDTQTYIIEDPIENDKVIQPYKYCDKYNRDTRDNPDSRVELNKYYEQKYFKDMLQNMRTRLGLVRELTALNVTAFYDLCRFFRAYTDTRKSPWCALFTDEELKVMEFGDDLKNFYRDSYGTALTDKLGAQPFKNLYDTFRSSMDGTNRITAYFSHDSMLEMMYRALGVFRDYPGISAYQIDEGRRWRTSFLVPFAGNIVAVLNRCSVNDVITHKVQIFIHEKVFPLCKAEACDWEEFSEKMQIYRNITLDFCEI